MRIKFFEPTYIRSRPDDLSDASIIGYIFTNTEIEVADEVVAGIAVEGNPNWYTDQNSWFYWSGRSMIVVWPEKKAETVVSAAAPTVETAIVSPAVLVVEMAAEPIFSQPDPPENAFSQPAEMPFSAPTIDQLPITENQSTNNRSPIFSQFVQDFPFRNLDEWVGAPSIPKGETRPADLFAKPNSTEFESFSFENGGVSRAVSAVATPSNPQSAIANPQSKNWGLESLNIAETFWQKGITGRGVRLAILSTGIDGGCFDLEEAVFDAFLPQNLLPATLEDEDGIGTQAATIAAGRGQNLFGAAPEADLLIGKIGSLDRTIAPENLLAGIEWAVAAGAEIVAMLVDFSSIDSVLETAISEKIEAATLLGIQFLAPVGNSTEKNPQRRFPAFLPKVLAVGSHDRAGQRSFFSAKSHDLDLLAPGEGLVCMGLGNQILPLNAPSTAIATAFAAGVLALLKQAERERPDFFEDQKSGFDRLRDLAFSPKNFVEKGEDVENGWGLLRLPID